MTLTANTGHQFQFLGWTGPCTPNGNQCTTTMDAAKAVTATFFCPPTGTCAGF